MKTVLWRGFLLNSPSSNQDKESSVLIIFIFQLKFRSIIFSYEFIMILIKSILHRSKFCVVAPPALLYYKENFHSHFYKKLETKVVIFSAFKKKISLISYTPLNRGIHICFYHLRYIRYTDTISYRVYISPHVRSKWRSSIRRESHVRPTYSLKNSNKLKFSDLKFL